MDTFIDTLIAKRQDLIAAIGQHIQLSLVSLLLAMVIAIPLALAVVNHHRAATVLTQVTGVFQTIPSLALLGLLIPVVGIGTIPAVIALVIYAILPVFTGTLTGITGIDCSLEEAATAFGMTRIEKLYRFEIPLALPSIIAGIRQALVMIIGTGTLAALIGAGGLGNFILLGIDRNNNTLTLIGALAAAVLAIVFSGFIYLLQKWPLRYAVATLSLIILYPLGATLYQAARPTPTTVTIAGKMGSEPDILINMYQDLIHQADPQIKVVLKPNFGQTSFLFNALKSKHIDIYPEFTGTVLESLVKPLKSQREVGVPAKQLYAFAQEDLARQFHMTYLPPMAYNNTYAVVIKKAFAQTHHIATILDLQKVAPQLLGGFDLEFLDRTDGYRGLQTKYGLNFKTQSMDPGLRYEAINNGKINVTDGYSTDSQIRQFHLVVLADNRQLFPLYQGAPLMNAAFAKKHPEIVKALNVLADKISEEDMQEMNYEVNVKKTPAATVAKHFLTTHGLLRGDK
ncbi:ABC transporter permease/substrate-binding protein [Schleiferilactobacillus perolens]|jgi:osmoprotectant transport system permease protein|uniref:ABC transporter permease/substrate-binding protein n=1 Tax=Schleiferilactobacillus perolens TaxID=100468 RepID=UPI0023533AC9|nr:ABC transporter permease/substrate-binding protein [Schleiferilactobacillus perolens]MCI2170916.1 ABC transporter permease/substrate-binding protein [Schleiferilactobacillus perolens]